MTTVSPGLFAYHCEAEVGSKQSETFKVMERSLCFATDRRFTDRREGASCTDEKMRSRADAVGAAEREGWKRLVRGRNTP
ncbi:hypothetical protein GGE24_007268 [Bradyrhizobium centrosematis]|nr:hypothetical protein [Bradyrhizobium centrosematis]MCS3777893.1 hypothetical protein [Bradyrhizobium centrosematis]